jgi:hypothetical protein
VGRSPDSASAASIGYSAFAIAIIDTGIDDLRIIADAFRDGVEGYSTDEHVVRQDGPIQRVGDLMGSAARLR